MMLVLLENDIKRLSSSSRAELMALMMSPDEDGMGPSEVFSTNSMVEVTGGNSVAPTADDVLEEKSVVDLSVDEARELVANISERSETTLKRFASGTPVTLASLIGSEGEYRDYSELKRSFVGAVNRRLRTVSGIRNAVLFSSDRDKTRIKITPKTALSLRSIFNLPEPLPVFEFVYRDGRPVEAGNESCAKLTDQLNDAWLEFDGRPNDESSDGWSERVLSHFAKAGFETFHGTVVGWDNDSESETFEFQRVPNPSIVIFNRFDESGPHGHELFFGLGDDPQVLARPVL